MSGHCEHCTLLCHRIEPRPFAPDLGVIEVLPAHQGVRGLKWRDGWCPYCAGAKAERERIADALDVEAQRWDDIADAERHDGDPYFDGYISDAKAEAFENAAKIARGEQ